jgi:hypothetical protein
VETILTQISPDFTGLGFQLFFSSPPDSFHRLLNFIAYPRDNAYNNFANI